MHLGEAEGGLALQAAVAERMFSAHFCEGRALDDPLVLQRVAPEAGLDEHRVAAVLAGDEYAEDVQDDQREAVRLQLSSVPFVLADRRIAARGHSRPTSCWCCCARRGRPARRRRLRLRPPGKPGGSVGRLGANLGVLSAGWAQTWGFCRPVGRKPGGSAGHRGRADPVLYVTAPADEDQANSPRPQ